ncbi:MAG TPA: ABC transporter permease [Firmicutes bacterium]|jgi:NitT/TauT family transport system permease protein|nr:ABC transporter permease [Bacillota bacterium]
MANRLFAFLRRYYEYLLMPLGLLIFVGLWQLVAGFYPAFILPGPSRVGTRLMEYMANGMLRQHFITTGYESIAGFVMGGLLALPLSYFLSRHPFVERCLTPYIVGVQAIPIVALAPLLVIWFGFGLSSKILVSGLVAFFPILTNGIMGFRSTDPRLLELMAIMGAKRKQIFFKLELPSALPVICGGLKLGITLAVIGAVVGEFAGSGRGLGYLVNAARGSFDTPLIFVALIALALLGIGFYILIAWFEYWLMPWRRRE